jgi:ADP-heptose:LPS heptosyltransferase
VSDAPRIRASTIELPGVLLVADPTFAEWSALYTLADLVVTPDCGAVHLAAAHGRPLVVVYAPDRLARALAEYRPWHAPFRAVGTQTEAEIAPRVLAAMAELQAAAPVGPMPGAAAGAAAATLAAV